MRMIQLTIFNTHTSREYDLNNEHDKNIVEQLKELYGENNVEIREDKK